MSSWVAVAGIGALEALKDQGFCRWNYAIKFLQQQAKTNLRSYSQPKKKTLSTPSSTILSKKLREDKLKRSEESLRKVMYISSWAPN